MKYQVQIVGAGYRLGSRVITNASVAAGLGLPEFWLEQRTGISERRLCDTSENEDVISLATDAISNCLRDAGIDRACIGTETVLIHIQNGLTHLTPPSPVLVCHRLGFRDVRPLGIEGVCSEPINAIEIGALMLERGLCDRVIVSASVDFIEAIDHRDPATAGLFGAGAGALVLERSINGISGILGSEWKTDTRYWELGTIPMLGHRRGADSVDVTFGYYRMNGVQLARKAMSVIPLVMTAVLKQAGWQVGDIDFLVPHQPNAKLLEMGVQRLKLDARKVAQHCKTLGNIGPASVLISFAMSKEQGHLVAGSNVLLLSFGLGFSCAGMALRF
jgi:3-oxoacyl-[acyl-carrier-protein] synthase-3